MQTNTHSDRHRTDLKNLTGRERDMQKESNARSRCVGSDILRKEHEMVVMHPQQIIRSCNHVYHLSMGIVKGPRTF
jgi:hypothetical protein